MERKVVATALFRKKLLNLVDYIGNEFGSKPVLEFLDQLDNKLKQVIEHPESGSPMLKRKNVRSVILKPHNKIFYKIYPHKITLLDIIDMRRDPAKNPFQ